MEGELGVEMPKKSQMEGNAATTTGSAVPLILGEGGDNTAKLTRSLSSEHRSGVAIAKTGLVEQQNDSGIESCDQPLSSSGTSQRSSPSDGSENSTNKGLKQSSSGTAPNAKKGAEPSKSVSLIRICNS